MNFWDLIDYIDLSNQTLLFAFFLPFSYYLYCSVFWYDEARIKLLNFINISVSILLILICTCKIYSITLLEEKTDTTILVIILHYLIAFLTLLSIFKSNNASTNLVDLMVKKAIPVGGSGKSPKKPQAVSKEVIGTYTWDDIIINEDLKSELESVIRLLKDPDSAKKYGINLPKGILFCGPPGTGKTTIARVVANMSGCNFFVLQTNEIVSKWVGESEKNLTNFFDEAANNAPAIIFIDEIDSIAKSRASSNEEHSDKLLNQLLQLIDGVIKRDGIYVIGATNRADLVDSALKRAGRLNRTIEIGLPREEARLKLFQLYTKKLSLSPDIHLEQLVEKTHYCSAADIRSICDQAGLYAYRREELLPADQKTFLVLPEEMNRAVDDFMATKKDATEDQPKQDNEIVPQNDKVEKLTWDDIIIAKSLQDELTSVVKLLSDAKTAKEFGIEVPKGILLYGPPGTGKTTIAKVMASYAAMSFFVFTASSVISKYVGESEKNLTKLFNAAAKYAPSIIFIDEIDSIAKNRSGKNEAHADNLLNHLLQLIDGAIKRDGIFIIGATNREDLVDPALKRGGRLTKSILVPLPDIDGVKKLLKIFSRKLKLEPGIDFELLAQKCLGKSGADIRAICSQAGINSFTRNSNLGLKDYIVTAEDFSNAVNTFVKEEG